jgi:hypothetical protein
MKSDNSIDVETTAPESTRAIGELAQIFAIGILRLHQCGDLPFGSDGLSLQTALKTASKDLEQFRGTGLSVTRG